MEVTLHKTCDACPEQYDVFDENKIQIAYLRFRWGHFRVDCPNCGGETVYSVDVSNHLDGVFPNDATRKLHIRNALQAVAYYYKTQIDKYNVVEDITV